MTRRMSPSRRARIFSEADGICHICGQPIDGTRERWEIEHIVPYALTRDDSDENLAPAHVSCHRGKTAEDAGSIAKAKRVSRKHQGAHRPKSTIPGSRGSKWKRKIGGGTVLREEDQ
ncbi:HNH endonuclease [Mameliella alba]|uniref:HNH endonuclease n=1 Tax=Mameliella alba TaxID=561184 RepID=UPI000B52A9C5|nr:HNH endonuclease signature motif containing protein [Mameliella alba]OWV44237.1 endonuclease [Mameliella alba]